MQTGEIYTNKSEVNSVVPPLNPKLPIPTFAQQKCKHLN